MAGPLAGCVTASRKRWTWSGASRASWSYLAARAADSSARVTDARAWLYRPTMASRVAASRSDRLVVSLMRAAIALGDRSSPAEVARSTGRVASTAGREAGVVAGALVAAVAGAAPVIHAAASAQTLHAQGTTAPVLVRANRTGISISAILHTSRPAGGGAANC